MSQFETMFVNNELSVMNFTVMFEKILFVRMPEELKEKWETPEGKVTSQFRRLVMSSCLQIARKNLFDDFAPRDPDEHKKDDCMFDRDGRPVMPTWLVMAEKERKSKTKSKIKKE